MSGGIKNRLDRVEATLAEAGACSTCENYPYVFRCERSELLFDRDGMDLSQPVNCPTCGRQRQIIELVFSEPTELTRQENHA